MRKRGGIKLRAGRAEAADGGQILGARAQVTLLPAAKKVGRQREVRADVQSAHTLAGVDFMAGDGDHVRAERFCLEGNFQKALHRVGVK